MNKASTGLARHEGLVLALILLAWLSVNLVTASRSPTVWGDEVQCTDASLNFLQGRGFHSTAFDYQSRDRVLPWVSFTHAAGVYAMMRLFGFAPTPVRATNFLFVVIAVVLLCRTLRATGLVRDARTRLLWAVLVLCGYGITFSYRSGRYDMVGFLAISVGISGLSRPPPWRYLLLVLSGAMTFLSGTQLPPFAFLIAVGLLVPYGRRVWAPAIAFGVGVASGVLVLFLLFWRLGVWGDFVRVVRHFAPNANLPTRIMAAIRPLDFSSVLLLPALALLVGWSWRQRGSSSLRSPAGLGLFAYGLISVGMAVVGRFPLYYTWMLFLPLTLCLAVAVDPLWDSWEARWVRRLALSLTAAACVIGLPARLSLTALQWSGRDYDLVRRFVAANVRPGDSLFSDWQTFYALRSRADVETFFNDYESLLTPAERRGLTGMLLAEGAATENLVAKIGGSWRVVARMTRRPATTGGALARLSARAYGDLVMYRRSDEAASR